jgi:hypothetical protein
MRMLCGLWFAFSLQLGEVEFGQSYITTRCICIFGESDCVFSACLLLLSSVILPSSSLRFAACCLDPCNNLDFKRTRMRMPVSLAVRAGTGTAHAHRACPYFSLSLARPHARTRTRVRAFPCPCPVLRRPCPSPRQPPVASRVEFARETT